MGFSMGGGDVTRYINNYGSARVAGLALLGAVTPIFGKSDSFPQGVDQSVFDGIRDGLRKIAPSSSATSRRRSTASTPGRPFPPVP